ncbi:MAG: undecaprenyldiphospho-muramoylpentapeptide beta-N-acetylglucosaminyltransferase [Candidatus Jorgensenbacteria bacterium]|nr:undecaprenyldiphospho-muramoylpentapeptide beta-N-acetylglucosaminyltransferase [Candidatus Jorgensenbacteria bacterium]
MLRIVLTGGGTGGHIYPLLAVADELLRVGSDALELSITYIGPRSPYTEMFRERGIGVRYVASSKLRRYASLENIIDAVKLPCSLIQALWHLYWIMPDAVFSKGGPGAFPTVVAARFYRIPVLIHESDSVPGLTSRASAYFASRIAISFAPAASYFPKQKIAFTGNPVRRELTENIPDRASAKGRIGFRREEPVVLILGGSQGAKRINTFVFDNLEAFTEKYQVFHQVGERNIDEAESVMETVKARAKYRIAGTLSTTELKDAMAAADVIISRAGSGAIYEIAAFGKPSILIPILESANNHQQLNAFEYEKNGAAVVVEENNLAPNIFFRELDGILSDSAKMQIMGNQARVFSKPDAGSVLAGELLRLAGVRG